jgi:hypothetical protein
MGGDLEEGAERGAWTWQHKSRMKSNVSLWTEVGSFFPDSTHKEAGLRASSGRLRGAGHEVLSGFYCQPLPRWLAI